MLKIICIVLLCGLYRVGSTEFKSLDRLRPSSHPVAQTQAVSDLIYRVVGERSKDINVTVDPSLGPHDRATFKLTTIDGRLNIVGNTGVAVASGFYYYLSQYCGCHISWAGNQIKIPERLPELPTSGILVTSADRFRYYQNVCTVSYSFVWWDWTRWEREIDWMAMNGINLPLAFNAQEAIWQRVFLGMGFSQAELDNHFGGAAFLAWARMGNMHGWGGPLPQSWHEKEIKLQHQILDRMRGLGMIPVLPAFPGHVPNAIKRVFPSAKVSRLGDWGRFNDTFCCTLLLDLHDSLFSVIGKAFIQEYVKEFGTNHIYNTDTFNEMSPESGDPEYLRAAGKAVYDTMLAGDSEAIWLMQGWLFLDGFWTPERAKALLTSVPIGRMIVLDLFSEVRPQYSRLESYFGQPFIWCMLHNFGGTLSMYGVIESVNKGPSMTRRLANSTMVGIGLTPEGINQNNMIYEFMLENSWRTSPRNISKWIEDYALRRYGVANPTVNHAWQILRRGVYNCTEDYADHGMELVVVRPGIQISPPQLWYSAEDFFKAWDHFIDAADHMLDSKLYRYDLVDVSRQSLQLIFELLYHQVVKAYKQSSIQDFSKSSRKLLSLLIDLDGLLATDDHFLLGRWLGDAKSWARDDKELKLYEYNARNQITLWGPDGNILDYANKQWAGLVQGYYYPRWKLFIEELQTHWNGTFDQNKFNLDVFKQVEQTFTFDDNIYPTKAIGDQIEESRRIHAIYRPLTEGSHKYFNTRRRAKHTRDNRTKTSIPFSSANFL